MVSAQSLSNSPTLHPAKFKGGVERGVPFTLLGCRLIFTRLEQIVISGHEADISHEGHVFRPEKNLVQ